MIAIKEYQEWRCASLIFVKMKKYSFIILILPQYLVYALGFFSLAISGFSWLIVGLIIAVWWARGAITMCMQKQELEGGPGWEFPLHVIVHVVLMLALCGFSFAHIFK